MARTDTGPERAARPSPGYAYLMTGIAIACICVSGVLGGIFVPKLVTGIQHQQTPIAAFTGWIWNLIAIAMVVSAAIKGIRANVTDRAPWTVLGLGVGALWIATMFVAIFAPVWVTGTDPEKLPIWALVAAIAAVVVTWILCSFVKTASFEAAAPVPGSATTPATVDLPSEADDATGKLRRLAQLRDSGVITDAEFQAKKDDLLSRI